MGTNFRCAFVTVNGLLCVPLSVRSRDLAPGCTQFRVGNTRGTEIYSATLSLTYSHVAVDDFGIVSVANDELPLVSSTKSCMRYMPRGVNLSSQ